MFQVLLKHGADPNAQSKFDKTPADISNDLGRTDLANILQVYTYSIPSVLKQLYNQICIIYCI